MAAGLCWVAVNLLAAEEVALLAGRDRQVPGADLGLKGCPSEGCLQLLRTGQAAVGAGSKSPGTPGKELCLHLRRWRATSKLSFREGSMMSFLRGYSPPGDFDREWCFNSEKFISFGGNASGSQACTEHWSDLPQIRSRERRTTPFSLKTTLKMWDFCPGLASKSHKRNAFTLGILEHLQMFIKFCQSVKI